jgi:hypothetical protein
LATHGRAVAINELIEKINITFIHTLLSSLIPTALVLGSFGTITTTEAEIINIANSNRV